MIEEAIAQLTGLHLQEGALDKTHHLKLFDQLGEYSAKWKDIGTYLGFYQRQLDEISGRPGLFNEGPRGWLRAMLSEWLQWTPDDPRGGSPTLAKLKTAVSKAGLGRTASELTL